jgi:hypothetical protein
MHFSFCRIFQCSFPAIYLLFAAVSCKKPGNAVLQTALIVESPNTSKETIIQFVSLPKNPVIVFKCSKGFANWNDALGAFAQVVGHIELAPNTGALVRFEIGSNLSENVGLYSSRRPDNSIDYGTRLMMSELAAGKMTITINDTTNALCYPLTIEVQKLNEMP